MELDDTNSSSVSVIGVDDTLALHPPHWLEIVCIVLIALVYFVCMGSLLFVIHFRKRIVVRVAQPTFLIMLCVSGMVSIGVILDGRRCARKLCLQNKKSHSS